MEQKMYFVVQYLGREDGAAARATHHAAHVEFRKALGSRVLLSGPLLPVEGGVPAGSLFIVAADSLGDASDLAASDPLCVNGATELASVQPFKPMICNPPTAA